MLNASSHPDIAVIFPLVDPRGDPFEKLQSWFAGQSLPRERFQIIAVSNGSQPVTDKAVVALLATHDRLVHCPSGNLMELYNFGVRHTDAHLLLFTEHHCIADADCLGELLAWFGRNDCAGAALRVQSICLTDVARLDCRICEADLPALLASEHWNKVSMRGFAIRRDVLLAVGGLEASHESFAEVALGARLHSLGHRIGYAERAVVNHIDANTFSKSLGFVDAYTMGEIAYFATHDIEYCQRYFGIMPEWRIQQPEVKRTVVRELWRSLQSSLRMPVGKNNFVVLCTLVVEWLRHVGALLMTTPIRLGLARAHVALAWLRFVCWRWHETRRARAYAQARESMVHYVRLRYLSQQPIVHVPATEALLDFIPGRADETRLLGFHACENFNGDSFWWTGPSALVRLDMMPGEYDLVIDTRSLRGADCKFPLAFFVNGRRLTRDRITIDEGRIVLSVDAQLLDEGLQWLTIVCRPLKSRRERRRLGLPIFSLRVHCLDSRRLAA